MRKRYDERIENLSELVGGRFKLTTLIIKRMREFYLGGGTFMPRTHNQHDLLELVLDQIENKEIGLQMPGESAPATGEGSEEEAEEGPDITPEELLGENS